MAEGRIGVKGKNVLVLTYYFELSLALTTHGYFIRHMTFALVCFSVLPPAKRTMNTFNVEPPAALILKSIAKEHSDLRYCLGIGPCLDYALKFFVCLAPRGQFKNIARP
jgi:hypothetical protein